MKHAAVIVVVLAAVAGSTAWLLRAQASDNAAGEYAAGTYLAAGLFEGLAGREDGYRPRPNWIHRGWLHRGQCCSGGFDVEPPPSHALTSDGVTATLAWWIPLP